MMYNPGRWGHPPADGGILGWTSVASHEAKADLGIPKPPLSLRHGSLGGLGDQPLTCNGVLISLHFGPHFPFAATIL